MNRKIKINLSNNNKKIIIVAISVIIVFLVGFALKNASFINKLFANANDMESKYFDDENLYECVIDNYNKANGTSKTYEDNLNNDELSSITSLSCSDIDIENTNGIEKLTNLTELYFHNIRFELIDLTQNTNLSTIDLNGSSVNAVSMNIGETYEISDKILLPSNISYSYDIGNSDIVSVSDNKISALSNGVTYISIINSNDNTKVLNLGVVVGDISVNIDNSVEINEDENYIYMGAFNQKHINQILKNWSESNVGEIEVKDDTLKVVKDNIILKKYKLIYFDINNIYSSFGLYSNNTKYIVYFGSADNPDEFNVHPVNCSYELKNNGKNMDIIYNNKVIDELNVAYIYVPKRYAYIFGSIYMSSDKLSESIINNIDNINKIDNTKINILNAKMELSINSDNEEYPELLDKNNKEITYFYTNYLSSDKYDLKKDYIYLRTEKDFSNSIKIFKNGVEYPLDDVVKSGMINISDDAIELWDGYTECNDDESSCEYVKTLKIDEWKLVKISSGKYDLDSDTINLGDDEMFDTSSIDIKNGTISIEGDTLVIKFEDEVVDEIKIVGGKKSTTTTSTKPETTASNVTSSTTSKKPDKTTTRKVNNNTTENKTTVNDSTTKNSVKTSKRITSTTKVIKNRNEVENKQNNIQNRVHNSKRIIIIIVNIINLLLLLILFSMIYKKYRKQ